MNRQREGSSFINTYYYGNLFAALHSVSGFSPPNSYHFQNSLQAITKVGGEDKENGWFASVTSFFSKTLYW